MPRLVWIGLGVKTLASVPSRASNKNGKFKYRFPTRIAFV